MDDRNPEQSDDDQKGRTVQGTTLAIVGSVAAVVWLLNLSAGLIEVPDNLPIVGNIDEAFAAAVLFSCLRYLGIDVLPLFRNSTGKGDDQE